MKMRDWESAFAEAAAQQGELAAVAAILAEIHDPAQMAADAQEGEAVFASLD